MPSFKVYTADDSPLRIPPKPSLDEFQFKTENITVLTDFPNVPREKWPTKMNIVCLVLSLKVIDTSVLLQESAIYSFVHGAKAGDIHFVFCRSLSYNVGTGVDVIDIQTLDMGTKYPMLTAMKMTSKTSVCVHPYIQGRFDRTYFPDIVPCDALGPDFIEKKMIIDDLLKNILVMPLAAADANLTVNILPTTFDRPDLIHLKTVFDCCHSGTVLGTIYLMFNLWNFY